MDVTMPQLGETVTEGTVTRWLKAVGDNVELGESLFEVSTDKVDSEVPSPATGVVAEIRIEQGETVAVGMILAVITGDAAVSPPVSASTGAPTAAPAEKADAPAPAPAPAPVIPPVAVPTAKAPPSAPAPVVPAGGSLRPAGIVLSPVVRKLLDEYGIDASQVPATGTGGRLTRKDVINFAQQHPGNLGDASAHSTVVVTHADAPGGARGSVALAPQSAVTPASPVQPTAGLPGPSKPAPIPVPGPAPRADGDEVVPFDRVRKLISEHMVRSKATSAHVYTSVEVDFEHVERVRRAAKDSFKASEGVSLTYLPFIARAVCAAIEEFPIVNSSVGEDALIVHRDVNMGIAVDLNYQGLIAPVIRNVGALDLAGIARSIGDLADRARTKRLSPDEVAGGTFTITNPGPYGTLWTAPIINQPQTAILSTDGVRKKAVVIDVNGDDAIVAHHVGILVLTWDHRAFDGAYAAGFLNHVRRTLETRDWDQEVG